jgi:integrase
MLFKRGDVWWADFTIPGAGRTRISTGTGDRKAAQEFHDREKAKLWRAGKLGERVQRTWDEAAVRWLRENKAKADYSGDCLKIEFFQKHFAGRPLKSITAELICEVIEGNLADRAVATRNRYYALVRAIMRRAVRQWRWLDAADMPYLTLHREPKGRDRYLEREQFVRFMRELPEQWRPVVVFAVATGLRMSNVVGLRWDDVNLVEGSLTIKGDRTKNGDDLCVPLNELSRAVVEREAGKHNVFVFSHRGRPMGKARGSWWKAALKRAGIEDFKFHDLRHTWASWLIQNGASEHFVQAMGGWKTAAMVKRYASLRPKHLAATAGLIDQIVPVDALLAVA